MNKNIKISFLYNFLTFFNITSAIWVLYLGYRGLSLVEIGLLESIFHITSFLCEIPTGAIADIYGRKTSVMLGRIMSGISTILMIYSKSFTGYAISFILSGLSYNLNSGAADSIIYDSLKQLKREGEFKKIFGSITFYTEVARALAVLMGGVLSDIRFVYAYILAFVIDCSAFLSSSFFTEPPIETEKHSENIFISQIKESINVLKDKKSVLYLILFNAVISTIDTIIYFYCQKYFENMNFSRTAIAFVFMFSNLLSAFGSKYAYIIEKRLNLKEIIIILPIVNALILTGLAFTKGYISVVFFLMSSVTGGIMLPIYSDYINSLIPSQNRATILSFDSLCFSAIMLGAFPLVGYIAERIGLSLAFCFIGLLCIPLIVLIMFKLNHSRYEEAADTK